MKNKKFVIAAVPYSDNLGDGVISDNIASAISRNSSASVEICDISFRDGVTAMKMKENGLSVFMKLPQFLRHLIVVSFFTLKYLRKGKAYYDAKLANADHILVGGGQLICDVDANFPLKLYFLAKEAEKRSIPFSVISVGVAKRWTWFGRKLMARVLTSKMCQKISVRDQLSRQNLQRFFALDEVELLPDPALLSSAVPAYAAQPKAADKPVLGLGIADIDGLNYSADIVNSEEQNNVSILLDIIGAANNKGLSVELFTNGAIEDERYLHEVVVPLATKKQLAFSVAAKSESSQALVTLIRGFSVVMAYRLHANIIAKSFNIPTYAIAWDNKVASFFDYMGQPERAYPNLKALQLDINNVFESYEQASSDIDISYYENMYRDFIGVSCEAK